MAQPFLGEDDGGSHLSELAGPAVRAFMGLAKAWRLNEQEKMRLLGITDRHALSRWRRGSVSAITPEIIERISYLLGIFEAINVLLPDPARADGWVRALNRAPPFGGRSALERMTDGSISDLQAVREFLDDQLR